MEKNVDEKIHGNFLGGTSNRGHQQTGYIFQAYNLTHLGQVNVISYAYPRTPKYVPFI